MPGASNSGMASVRKLKPNKRNARTHSKKQICHITESVRRFGWTYPILIDESNNVLAGHGRLEAAKFLRLREVPIIVIAGLSEAEKRALSLADNKIAANAGWDRKLLAAELGELATLLPECNLSIDITGFEASEIDALMGDLVEISGLKTFVFFEQSTELQRNETTENARQANRLFRRTEVWPEGAARLMRLSWLVENLLA